ncbi:hypothetical protein RRG08_050225 [Elysia crispata]|uniref:Uncharacterized protein n=1 Tax=Elysia crispata TaxID=231223 RepID=A0AAE1ASS1_9GAST|nr:hypothetical protein RRG08_050225 [Elysia crispata]
MRRIKERNLYISPSFPLTSSVQAVERDGPYGSYGLGTFYVNLKEADKRSTFTIKPLTLHEAYPGHHYQDCYSQHFDIPLYRAKPLMGRLYSVPFHFPVYTAYAEGWALYAEYLGEEMGLYDGPYDLFGRYVSEIFRACRLVVDSGIHAFNWNRTQAIDFLRGYSDFPESQLEAEVDRYITAPGQACAYKVGEIKIRHMREKTQNSLGPLFDIREFHHQILQVGYVPWISSRKWLMTGCIPYSTRPPQNPPPPRKSPGVTSQYGKLRSGATPSARKLQIFSMTSQISSLFLAILSFVCVGRGATRTNFSGWTYLSVILLVMMMFDIQERQISCLYLFQ